MCITTCLKRAIASAELSLGKLAISAKAANGKAAAGIAQVKAGVSVLNEQITTARTQLLAFLSINWAVGKTQEIVQIADAWNRMAVRMQGGERQQALTITESISQALRISGASANETQSALLQFGQALAAGVLRGEESWS